MDKAQVLFVVYADKDDNQRQYAYISRAGVNVRYEVLEEHTEDEPLTKLYIHLSFYDSVEDATEDARRYCRKEDIKVLLDDGKWYDIYIPEK